MPQSTDLLVQFGGGYAPIASGIPHTQRLPTEGLPFVGQGGFGALAGMAATPAMYRAFGQVGMVPMGLGHDQNVYDRLMNQRFTEMQMQAMRHAAETDRQAMMQTLRGVAAMTGTPFGAEQRHAASALTNRMVTFAPVMAQLMPDLMDQMGGLRGSAAVLASRMIDAGRYRIDPVTGQMGMSAESAGMAARSVHRDLFSLDNLRQMRGMTAGQAGSLFQELQLRGMVSTAAAERDPRGAIARAARDLGLGANLSPGDLDKMALDPRVADRLRSMDTDRIKQTLKGYAGAVAAMRDIFGDMGKPNAPMSQIVAGLEALTQGSMAQLDPGRMASMARQTYNLARQTGVTLDSALLLQQHAAHRGMALGLEPVFAVQAAQGGLAFGGAYRAQGHAAHTSWGAMSADQLTQLDINLRQQAAASPMANQLAVAMRLSRTSGGFAPGSDAARMVQAVRAGTTQFQDSSGRLRDLNMSHGELATILAGGAPGVTQDDVLAMLSQTDTNREYVERYGIAGTVRRAQRDELQQFVGHRMEETLAARVQAQLESQGVPAAEASRRAREIAGRAGQASTRRMFGLSTAEFANAGEREAAMAGILGDELSRAGLDLGGMSEGDRRRFLTQTADRFYGHANRAIAGSRFSAFGNLQNVHRATNTVVMDEADRQQMQARHRADMQASMAGLGQGSILSRAVDALQRARPGDDQAALKVIASALGGVNAEDINKALLPQMQEVVNKQRAVEDLQTQITNERDPAKRAALQDQLDVARRELTAQVGSLAKAGEQFGAFAAPSLTAEDVRRAGQSGTRLAEVRAFVGQHGMSATPTAAEQASYRRRYAGLWASESGAAIREAVDYFGQDVENVAMKLVGGPEGVRRYGSGAIRTADELRGGQQRLRELAMYHSRGDIARLVAGDLNVDATTPEGRETLARVRSEVDQILNRQQALMSEVGSRQGQGGRQFLLSDAEEAQRLGVTEKVVGLYKQLTPDEENALLGGDKDAIAKIAARLGATEEDLTGVGTAARKLQEAQKAALGADQASPASLVRDILTELGTSPGDETTAVQQQLAAGMGGVRGMAMGRRFLTSTRTLKEAAARKAGGRTGREGIDDLRAAYMDAMKGDAAKQSAFRQEYGLGDDKAWSEFEQAMQFQQQTGLLGFDGREESLLKAYSKAMGGDLARPAGDGPGALQFPSRLEMSGTVTIVGDQMDMSGAWGGGRNHVPPGGQ